MKPIDASRALAIAAGLVIIGLTGAAFWLSYAHLAEVALAHGLGTAPERAWAWPATLDLFIVAGELLMLRAALKRQVDGWAIALTAVGSVGSIVLNVAGVTGNRDPGTVPLLDYVVAAVPPTAALLAFGALMRQIHQALATRSEANLVDIIHEVPAPEVAVERETGDTNVSPSVAEAFSSESLPLGMPTVPTGTLPAPTVPAEPASVPAVPPTGSGAADIESEGTGNTTFNRQVAEARHWLANEPELTGTAIGKRLGTSDTYGRRVRRAALATA